MNRMDIWRELESVLSVVQDGEYISADLMMQSLRSRTPINHKINEDLIHIHKAIQKGTYLEMVTRLQNCLDMLHPVR